ncbi:MAG: hypothetical protein GX409_09615 [candidate division Zixibacteria bacterium]|nr:hypothetical protein [candidate division Zixibacteria bacterium]
MEILTESSAKQNDRLVTVFAVFAILIAIAISFASLGNHDIVSPAVENPEDIAADAAAAGIQAAKGHIECHSLKSGGSLPRQYYVNGGRFEVIWGEFNPIDSTVKIRSTGYYELPGVADEFGTKSYCARLETDLKVNLIATHNQSPILARYYQRHQLAIESNLRAAR